MLELQASAIRVRSAIVAGLLLTLLAGCSGRVLEQPPTRHPDVVRAQLVRLMPATVTDRQGWANDIYVAFADRELEASDSQLCAVLAVIEQESTYRADPPVTGLATLARREIDQRAETLHIPAFLVDAALGLKSPTGERYAERLAKVRTEKALSAIFDDFIGMVPMGQQLFGGLNPVRTGGPMQVSIEFAERLADDYPYVIDGSLRQEVFTRRGGLYFGIAHLLDYPASYSSPVYRFADFNAGWYASRNAAFQHAVSRLSGITLALDGDLIIHGSRQAGQTERAVRSLSARLDLSDAAIRRDLERGDSQDFENSRLYARVFALVEQLEGRSVPRARLPGIALKSPKITRNLTTAWFAERVETRWKNCLGRAKTG